MNFDYSVIINESGFSEQIISSLSKKYQIPCIHMQEGFHWDSIGAKENLSSQGVFLEDAEKLAVWGEIDKKLAIEIGKISPEKIVEDRGLIQVSDIKEIEKIIEKIINENQDKVKEYKSGKNKLLGFFVGLAMKESKGRANPKKLNEILIEKLK